MVTTNLALAKHLDGRALNEGDIRVGLEVVYPSQTGGVVHFRCVSCDEEGARFESTNPDWPTSFDMLFNQPDFTSDDFRALSEALSAFDSMEVTVSDEQRHLVARAKELGYATQMSHTQAHWTEKGVATATALWGEDRSVEPEPPRRR